MNKYDGWGEEGACSSTTTMSTTATPEETEVKDYSDFITVDLLRIEEMQALQKNHGLNIVGFEMFNPETGETAWVYLLHCESTEQGLMMLEEFGVKDLSEFRVYAIKHDQFWILR